MASYEKLRDSEELEAGLIVNQDNGAVTERAQGEEPTDPQDSRRPKLSPVQRVLLALFITVFIGFTLLRGVALASVYCITTTYSELGNQAKLLEDDARLQVLASTSPEELCRLYGEACPNAMDEVKDDWETVEPAVEPSLDKRQDNGNTTSTPAAPPTTSSSSLETSTSEVPATTSNPPTTSDIETSSEPPTSQETTSSQAPPTTSSVETTTSERSSSAQPSTSDPVTTSEPGPSTATTSERPASSSGERSTNPPTDAPTSNPPTAAPSASSSAPRSSTRSGAPSSTSSSSDEEPSGTPSSSSTRRTITTGSVTTSSADRHTYTKTLADGGATTITSTSWVEVVPSKPTEQSENEPDLQGSASGWQRNTLLQMAMGVLVGGILMV